MAVVEDQVKINKLINKSIHSRLSLAWIKIQAICWTVLCNEQDWSSLENIASVHIVQKKIEWKDISKGAE